MATLESSERTRTVKYPKFEQVNFSKPVIGKQITYQSMERMKGRQINCVVENLCILIGQMGMR